MSLCQYQASRGYYSLPNVARPVNPRDPLGLWDVYFEDRAQRVAEKKNEESKTTEVYQQKQKVRQQNFTKPSYADIVGSNMTTTKSSYNKTNPNTMRQHKRKMVVDEWY